MQETRYLLKISKEDFKKLKQEIDLSKHDWHINYYFPDFRLRQTHYHQDGYKIKYLIILSKLGTSQAVKQKTEISEQEFKKLLNENHKDLIFKQKAEFFHLKKIPIMIEHDFIEYKNNKKFDFWATEAESQQDKKYVEQFLKENNIKYYKTQDNIRTIVEKLAADDKNIREYIIQEAKNIILEKVKGQL